jgi:hypothetical protein
MLAHEGPTGVGRPPWRLHQLEGRQRVVAAVLAVLLLVPFATALARAAADDWAVTGDEAHIAARSLDVFSRHPPLTGQPSTSFDYGDRTFAHHPGPIELYLLAVPYRLLGRTAGPLATAAAINAGAVLVALWTVFRRAGPGVAVWAAFLLQAVLWSGGTAVLVDTLSSNMTMYSLLVTAVVSWALLDGDLRLLPLGAFVASYAAQQHLAIGFLVASITAAGVGGLALSLLNRHRRGQAVPRPEVVRSVLAAGVVAAICWAPVVIDQALPERGNLSAILQVVRDSDRETLGPTSGLHQALRAAAPPSVLGDTDHDGLSLSEPPGGLRQAVGASVLVGLAAVAWGARRARPSLATLAVMALVVVAAGALTGSNVPDSIEASRVNLYRWMWTAAFLTVTAAGWALALVVRRVTRPVTGADLGPVAVPALLLGTAALTVTSVVVEGADDANHQAPVFGLERELAAAVVDRVDGEGPVVVLWEGSMAHNLAYHIAFRLIEDGVRVQVPTGTSPWFGRHRRFDEDTVQMGVLLSSDDGPGRRPPGELIESLALHPQVSRLVDELEASVRGEPVTVDPSVRQAIADEPPLVQLQALELLEDLSEDPRPALTNHVVLGLVADGRVRAPGIDRDRARRLLDVLPEDRTYFLDDRVQARLLDRTQVLRHPTAG